MLRALWVSDHPRATSGYSNQTALTAPRLQRAGLAEVAILASYGQHGYMSEFEGLPVFPAGADGFGNDVIGRVARQWRADVVITLKDVGVYHPQAFDGLRWCPLTPIDHEPPPPAVIERLRIAYQPIAYAPNGVRDLRRLGFDPAYAPHGYDPAIYAPGDRAEARAALGLPQDAFVIATVAVNRGGLPSRKAWPQLIEAVGMARPTIPHLVWLCHTDRAADGHEHGIPLDPLLAQAGIADRTVLPSSDAYRSGMPHAHLHRIYVAADALLAVSLGEGFGLPALEAQACGTPVIVSGWAAHADLCFAGWQLRREDAMPYLDAQLAGVYIPHPGAIAACLRDAAATLADPARRAALSAQALDGARDYQIDRVIETHWRPLLADLERRIADETRKSRGVLRIVHPREVLA